jgi:integrase/recombinase XerC
MAYAFKREPLTQAEATKLVDSCQTLQEKFCVWGLLDTGLREHELIGIKRENVDWQKGSVIIWGKANPKTGEKTRRVIPLTPRVKILLEQMYTVHNGIPYSLKTVWRVVHRVANKAMIMRKCSPHVLRHTFAVASLQAGLSLPALKAILGHRRLATTEIYLNMGNEEALAEFRRKIG